MRRQKKPLPRLFRRRAAPADHPKAPTRRKSCAKRQSACRQRLTKRMVCLKKLHARTQASASAPVAFFPPRPTDDLSQEAANKTEASETRPEESDVSPAEEAQAPVPLPEVPECVHEMMERLCCAAGGKPVSIEAFEASAAVHLPEAWVPTLSLCGGARIDEAFPDRYAFADHPSGKKSFFTCLKPSESNAEAEEAHEADCRSVPVPCPLAVPEVVHDGILLLIIQAGGAPIRLSYAETILARAFAWYAPQSFGFANTTALAAAFPERYVVNLEAQTASSRRLPECIPPDAKILEIDLSGTPGASRAKNLRDARNGGALERRRGAAQGALCSAPGPLSGIHQALQAGAIAPGIHLGFPILLPGGPYRRRA